MDNKGRLLSGFINHRKFIFGSFIIVSLIIIFYAFKVGWLSPTLLILLFENKPALGPIIFLGMYIILTISSVPTLPLNLAAGFLWGWFGGTLLTVMGASSGALITFFISRYFFRSIFVEKFKGSVWRDLDEGVKKNEWKVILFTRLNPAFPFGLTNWFFGISEVSIFKFAMGTCLGIFPGALVFSVIGSSVGQMMLTDTQRDIYMKIVLTFAIATLILCLFFLRKYIYKSFKGKF